MKCHPLAIAWRKYKGKESGSFVVETLGNVLATSYLENRISRAFNAGAEAQREIYSRALANADGLVEDDEGGG